MINKINKIIFKYLDSQNFVVIGDTDSIIHFVNSESDEYGTISYFKTNGSCYIYYKLIEEISTFFSMEESDSKKVIGSWVENTLQIRVTNTQFLSTLNRATVENTLQIRVTNTTLAFEAGNSALRIPYK